VNSNWIKEVFNVEKPVIAMCHLDAMPGDPMYDQDKGVSYILENAYKNLNALQDGGVNAVMFSNEYSLPYLTKVKPITAITMARIIGELKKEIKIPFGVNVLWDASASCELAVATDALFVREIFSGVYASDFGLWDTNCGETIRKRNEIGGKNVKLLYNIYPEASSYLGNRKLSDVAKTTVFNCRPDAICVSGQTAGVETNINLLKETVDAVEGVPVFANTGVNISNVKEQLSVASGCVIGSAFKSGDFFSLVDKEKVLRFMDVARTVQ